MEPHSRRASLEQEAENTLRVIVMDPAWRRFVPRLSALVARAAGVAGIGATVVLADDRLVRTLNRRHRGRDKPTNVLTYEEPEPEMVLALGVVRREAAAARKRVSDHLLHLIIHGALHLRGHDHDHPGDAREMEMHEARLLHRIGVPNPWRHA
jgi:probable rRNA maturation factor